MGPGTVHSAFNLASWGPGLLASSLLEEQARVKQMGGRKVLRGSFRPVM